MQNKKIRNLKTETLSDNWYTLRKATFDYLKKDGKTIMLLQHVRLKGIL